MKLISLLSTLVFVNIHYIRGNGIRMPLSIYDEGLHKDKYGSYEDDQGLYGTISIGTPPQKFNVVFSTRDTDISVLSSYSYCRSSVCQNHKTYNHEKSTTFRGPDDFDTQIRRNNYPTATDTITVGSLLVKTCGIFNFGKFRWVKSSKSVHLQSDLKGEWEQCKIAVKEIGDFQIQNVSFWIFTSGDAYNNKPWDGIVGLTRSSEVLKQCEKLGLKKEFSLYTNSPWDNNNSELMLCGEDKKKFQGNLQYLTATAEYSVWDIEIQSIMLHHNHENVQTMKFQNAKLEFNIVSSYIIGPAKDVKKIYKALNTRKSKIRDDLQEVDCNNIHALPSITFGTADNYFTLTGNDYIKQMTQNDERVCIVRLLSHSENYWIIGSVFFRKYYTVFDAENSRIGFAESVHPPTQIMVFLF